MSSARGGRTHTTRTHTRARAHTKGEKTKNKKMQHPPHTRLKHALVFVVVMIFVLFRSLLCYGRADRSYRKPGGTLRPPAAHALFLNGCDGGETAFLWSAWMAAANKWWLVPRATPVDRFDRSIDRSTFKAKPSSLHCPWTLIMIHCLFVASFC